MAENSPDDLVKKQDVRKEKAYKTNGTCLNNNRMQIKATYIQEKEGEKVTVGALSLSPHRIQAISFDFCNSNFRILLLALSELHVFSELGKKTFRRLKFFYLRQGIQLIAP